MKHITCNIQKNFIVFVLCATCYMLYATCVSAQQVNLSLDPPIVQAKIKSGKSIIVAYTIENMGDPINLQLLIRPFTPVGQLGSLSVAEQLEGPVQFNLENADLTLEKPFFFPSKEKRQAVVRIQVPLGVPDSDYYYLVLAETVPAFSIAGQSTGITSASIGSPLLISVTESGITETKATIVEFSFKPDYTFTIGNSIVRIVDNAKELPIVCSVQNMGKNLIQPQGTITDQSSTLKKTYTIIPQNILSNSQRIIKVSSDENNNQTDSTLVLSHLSVGSHRITAEISFGENSSRQYKMFSFFALPLRLMVISFIVLIMVNIMFIIRFLTKKNRK